MSRAEPLDPVADINAAEIKDKLDTLIERVGELIGRMEALEAALGSLGVDRPALTASNRR